MRGFTVHKDSLRACIEEAQGGSREAFDRIARELEERLRASIRSRIGPHLRLEEDDVLQETLARAYASLGRFEWQGEGSFLRWLCGIAENFICGAADKQRRRAALELEPRRPAPSQVSPSRALQRQERQDRLERALASLSPEHRQVIQLARIEGLQVQEIAVRLGKSSSAVKNQLLRALKELKRSFGDTGSFRLPGPRKGAGGESDGER